MLIVESSSLITSLTFGRVAQLLPQLPVVPLLLPSAPKQPRVMLRAVYRKVLT